MGFFNDQPYQVETIMSGLPVSRPLYLVLIIFCCCLTSCSGLLTSTVIQPAVGNLQQQTDIDLVCEGAPSYLLMLDSMLISSPKDRALLLIATQSYSAYAAALEECGEVEENRIAKIAYAPPSARDS